MRITVSGRHMSVSDKLKTYATEKSGKLDRYYDRVQSVEVVFDKASDHFVCEVIAKADHQMTFVAKEQREEPYAAFDIAVKELERQLTRHKEKFRNRKHPGRGTEREPMDGLSQGSPQIEG